MQLPEDHELIEKHGKPDLTRIRDILSKPEITLIEATKVFNEYPIDEVRKDVNQAYYKQFKDEADQTIMDTKDLFIKEGVWFEDSYGISVPMSRLKETQQGIGLSREDFAAARDILRIKTLTASEDRLYKALTLEDFKRLTDGLVIAHRKSNYMFNFLNEKGISLDEKEGLIQAKPFKDSMLKGSKYDIVENFELEKDISIDEFIKRADSSFRFEDGVRRWDSKKDYVKLKELYSKYKS